MIVVGCKLDLRDERQPMNLEQVMAPIMQQFREIETCIECSSATLIQVSFFLFIFFRLTLQSFFSCYSIYFYDVLALALVVQLLTGGCRL